MCVAEVVADVCLCCPPRSVFVVAVMWDIRPYYWITGGGVGGRVCSVMW